MRWIGRLSENPAYLVFTLPCAVSRPTWRSGESIIDSTSSSNEEDGIDDERYEAYEECKEGNEGANNVCRAIISELRVNLWIFAGKFTKDHVIRQTDDNGDEDDSSGYRV